MKAAAGNLKMSWLQLVGLDNIILSLVPRHGGVARPSSTPIGSWKVTYKGLFFSGHW